MVYSRNAVPVDFRVGVVGAVLVAVGEAVAVGVRPATLVDKVVRELLVRDAVPRDRVERPVCRDLDVAVRRVATGHVLGGPVVVGLRVVAGIDAQDRLAEWARLHDSLNILDRGLPGMLVCVIPARYEGDFRVDQLEKFEAVNAVPADIGGAVVVHQHRVHIAIEVEDDNIVNGLLVRSLRVASHVHVEAVVGEESRDGFVVLAASGGYARPVPHIDGVRRVRCAHGEEAEGGAAAEVDVRSLGLGIDLDGGALTRGIDDVGVLGGNKAAVLRIRATPVVEGAEVIGTVGHFQHQVVQSPDVIGVVVAGDGVVNVTDSLAVQEGLQLRGKRIAASLVKEDDRAVRAADERGSPGRLVSPDDPDVEVVLAEGGPRQGQNEKSGHEECRERA